jgi:hypothetical protein
MVESLNRMKTKTIGLIGLMGLMVLCARGATTGATITNEFRNGAYRLPGAQLKWENLSAPYVAADSSMVTREAIYTPLTNGFLNATLYGGTYRVTFGNSAQEVWTLQVPGDGGTYPFYFLATNTTVRFQTNFSGRVPVFNGTNVAGDGVGLFRTNSSGVLEFLRITGSGGATVVNQGNTNIVIAASASSGTTGDILDDDTGEDILDGH